MPLLNRVMQLALCISVSFVVNGCGGGGAGGGSTTGSGVQYSLTPSQIPVSIHDKLVTVTVTQGTTNLAFADRLINMLTPVWDAILPSAFANQLSPTLSSRATAKIVGGQAELVSPIFTATVTKTDPADPSKTIQATVNVTCDIDSIPLTIHVNKAWAINYATRDLLVNMDYPISVTATYHEQTNTFSSCSFVYTTGYFLVFGDNSVSAPLDPALGEGPVQSGCWGRTALDTIRVIAAGDPTRNPTNTPIINSLYDTSLVTATGYTLGSFCGSLRAMNYSRSPASATFTTINFNTDIQTTNDSIVVDAAQNIYAIGSDRNYGGIAINTACPVSVTKAGNASATCLSVPNLSSFVNYPVTAAQLQAAGTYGPFLVQESQPTMFIGQSGSPLLSLQPYAGLCNIGSCLGPILKPTLFNIDTATSTITALATPALDASGFPYGMAGNLIPIGFSNGYLMFSMGGPGIGILANINTGTVVKTCSNPVNGSDFGCNEADSFGDYVYGFLGCSSPYFCLNNPTIDRVNTATGVVEHWDLKAMGYVALNSMSNSTNTASVPVRPIFFTDHAVFLACPTSNLALPPNWVSLDFATGQITPVTTHGVTFDMVSTMIGTTLW